MRGPDTPTTDFKRLASFGGVGVVCTLIDFLIFAASIMVGVIPAAANTLAFLGANVFGYIANGKVTFRTERLSFVGFAKYCGAYFLTFLLSTAIVVVLAPRVGAYPAKGVAIIVTVCANYLLASRVVFKAR